MNYSKFIEQLLVGSILLLLGKAVVLVGGIYSTVLRMESRLDETYAKADKIGEMVDGHDRELADHEHRLKRIEHTN